ncbi:aminotransferase class V-fold PLP-dependent enzyme [Streptomyces rapamycinicus]|uniref:Aminotransferase class V domain-containing protein n=2 Tax=Streptomyces rapamycinicus TaxID=1226757 RepID=A0A0A0NCV5_STRRN|nr:aminotransferase class V-fold PLP-dependent enzyme [Streptomyces rapamycinicus]AGP52280.1 hypothetical protein M271_03250 [Streptomyces rapamycinicus NRRL 5491]MBB4779741.1 selenocysteine lyase/cysteine desulfurase [Streptomyces rapamycinicus]RLV75599.1 hypothetical protein D3C57_140275 [Streptomyces rapamycinicus NRRL 5491]UTP28472.1 aminotransferase class V-fold PLP-dependent enzyme [Streptomyces rapamycinicus NRRL 5491]
MEQTLSHTIAEPKPFDDQTLEYIRGQFAHLQRDALGNERIFFENSGGSLRLRPVSERALEVALYPESSVRPSKAARELDRVKERGLSDLLAFFGGDPEGALLPTATASQAMFAVVRTVAENVTGTNIVTTALEHPSSYDACARYARRTGQEMRVAQPDRHTGGITPGAIAGLVDAGTSLVSVIATSNITGAITDIPAVVEAVRAKNPQAYVVTDTVQYAPHGVLDVRAWGVDAANIAPYKMFGDRGNAFTYLSPRLARLDHEQFAGTSARTWAVGSAAPAVYAGFSAIMDYLASIGGTPAGSDRRTAITDGLRAIQQHEQTLLRALLGGTDNQSGLMATPGVRVHFADQTVTARPRDLIVALTFDDLECAEAVRAYEERGIVVYERVATSHYSERILRSLGLEGVVRVSPLHCHTLTEVDAFLAATRAIAERAAG